MWLSLNLFKFLSVLMGQHMQSIWGLLPSLLELRSCQNEMKNRSFSEGNRLAVNGETQKMVSGLETEQKKREEA